MFHELAIQCIGRIPEVYENRQPGEKVRDAGRAGAGGGLPVSLHLLLFGALY